MDIKFCMLIEKLEHYNPESFLHDEDNVHIKSIKLLSQDLFTFDPSILYIGKASCLPKIAADNQQVNLLCIEDTAIPANYKENLLLNLLVIEGHHDLYAIYNKIQEIIIGFQQWSLKLMDSLIHNKGLRHIIETGYELLGNPISLIDTSFKLLDYVRNAEFEYPIWKDAIIKGYVPEEYVSRIKSGRYIEKVYKSNFPVQQKLPTDKYEMMISNIEIGNKIIAHMTIFEYSRPFRKSDFEIVAFLGSVISSEMQKTKFFQNTRGIMYEYFMADLIDGKIKDPEIVEERVKYLDLNLKEYLYVLSIRLIRFNDDSASAFHIKDYMENMITGCKSIIYNDHIVMLVSRSDKNLLFEDTRIIEKFLRGNKLHCGISRCFTRVTDMRKHYLQSQKVIELGIRIHKEKTLFEYEQYKIYHILEAYSEEELMDFCHPALITLAEHDKHNNTAYAQSLYMYVLNDKNIVKAADSLHIHRNTMSYRIAKIKEIVKLNLEDQDLVFDLILSYKILEHKNRILGFR